MNRFVLAVVGTAFVAGCGTSGGKSIGSDFDSGLPTLDDYKRQLHEIVREEIVAGSRRADVSSATVHSYKPYYFKEYHDYPEGTDSYEIQFTEQESKTAPLIADVSVPKLRYTTDVQRDRAEVRADSDFQRERGVETISYELRNGNWRRVASLFVASEISTMSGGEWVPLEEEPRNIYDPFEDRDGWFRRTLNRLRIGDDPGAPNR